MGDEHNIETIDLEGLDRLANFMFNRRIARLRAGSIELEMSPEAWQEKTTAIIEPQGPATPMPTVKDLLVGVQGELCGCGHDLDTEHTEAGCLHGCADELCLPKDDTEPA